MQTTKYRRSQYQDTKKITDILSASFGELAINKGGLNRVNGQYVVALDEMSHIIAISGIINGNSSMSTITFACTHPKYRNMHVIVETADVKT